MGRGYWIVGVFGICALGLVACEGLPTGPSLNAIVVANLTPRPTLGDPSLCCCHLVGTARNNNTVGVHATFKFAVYDAAQQELSRSVFFISDFASNTTRTIDAPGFLFPCNLVKDVKYELSVRGLTEPAP
jgi:hypothetical protein